MIGKKIKLAMMANDKSRVTSLKKRRLGLVKKIRELTILCDVKACLIMVSPNEAEPMVWPSVEVARDLLDDFFALPEFTQKKKETTLESYLKEKIRRVHDQLRRTQKKNNEYEIDQLMVQLGGDRRIDDLNLNEIYGLLFFSNDKIMHLRRILDFIQHPPLPEPPVNLFEAQSEETTTNDIFMIGGGQDDEIARMTDEKAKRIINIGTLKENRSHYLMDRWVFPSFESPNPQIHQQIGMEMESYNQNPNPRCYLPYQKSYHSYQGSSSNGNPNLEMQPIGPPPVTTFHGMVGPVSQPLKHHHDMNNNPTMAMSQTRQYRFDFMSREEQSNIHISSSQFHRSYNVMMTNDGLRQEPPLNEATAEESNANATLFDINRDWPGFNNNHNF